MSIVIYFLFFLCAFLLGFFGLAPIIIVDLLSDKMPYIILVVLGYTTLIVLFVLWQNGYLKQLQNKNKKQEEYYVEEDLEIQTTSEEFDKNVEELMGEVEDSLEGKGIEDVKQGEKYEGNTRGEDVKEKDLIEMNKTEEFEEIKERDEISEIL